jgi:hypothetical protein
MPNGLTVHLGDVARAKSVKPKAFEPEAEHIRRIDTLVFEDFKPLLKLYISELGRVRGIDIKNWQAIESFDLAMSLFYVFRPQLVITDLSLTGGGTEGYAILEHIKSDSPNTLVVLTTSNYVPWGNDAFSNEVRSRGFDAVFPKLDIPAPGERHPTPHIEHLKSYLGKLVQNYH